ncbi:hypothetical protein [uncultured Anaerotruncus sp.]|nr:hypothetical protein [uncultured Anaerotruncus sp.]
MDERELLQAIGQMMDDKLSPRSTCVAKTPAKSSKTSRSPSKSVPLQMNG